MIKAGDMFQNIRSGEVFKVRSMDSSIIIREVILSQTDLSADIQACATLSCATNNLNDGLTLDFDGGPRINYWLVINNQMIQYSGNKPDSVLNATHNTADQIAGTLTIDDTGFGGPKVDAVFDVKLAKAYTANH